MRRGPAAPRCRRARGARARRREQRRDVRAAFERRALEAARTHQPHASIDGRQRGPRAFDAVLFVGRCDPDVDADRRVLGDDVGAGAAGDGAGVDGRAAVGGLQRRERHHLPGQFQNRRGAVLRCDAGVRRHTVRLEPERAHPLAARLQRAAGQRRLEHEHGLAVASLGFDQRARRAAAHFLVGGEQAAHPRAAQARARHVGGEDGDEQTRLHVEGARPVQPPVPNLHRHAVDRAGRPHRVEVSEQQDLTIAGADRGPEVIARCRCGQSLDPAADVLEQRGDGIGATPQRRRVATLRLDACERRGRLHEPCGAGRAGGAEVGQGGRCHGGLV